MGEVSIRNGDESEVTDEIIIATLIRALGVNGSENGENITHSD